MASERSIGLGYSHPHSIEEILLHLSNSKQCQRESHKTEAENRHPRSVLQKQEALFFYCIKKKSKGRES